MWLLSRAPLEINFDTVAVVHRLHTAGSAPGARHRHPTLHQLCWSPDGVLGAEAGEVMWAVPSSFALWIPAGCPHEVHSTAGQIECYDIKAYPAATPINWGGPALIAVTPLLRSLILHLADPNVEADARRRAEAVLFDQLRPAGVPGVNVPMPADPRVRSVARALLRDPADDRDLQGWARHAGSSARTLTRLFRDETGMSFHNWRLARIAAGLSHLAAGETVAAAGRKVGYQNASAFIDAFRRRMYITPKEFCAQFFPSPTASEVITYRPPVRATTQDHTAPFHPTIRDPRNAGCTGRHRS